jgi:hypothetical protein
MPAPTAAFYDTAIKVALSTEFMALLDVFGTCYIKLFDDDDVLLAQIYMNDPPGTVNADGSITLTTEIPEDSAPASGIAAYMELYNPDDDLFLTMPIVEGVSAQSGYLVMTSTTIIAGQRVAVTGFTIG